MFEAGGFGVAVSVSPAFPVVPADLDPVPEGVVRRPSRLTEVLDPAGFSDAGLVGELVSFVGERAQLAV